MSRRTAVALAAAALSGLLLWLSSPSMGLAALGWVALAPAAAVALARPETRAGRAALPLALVCGLELQLVPAFPFGLADDQWGEPVVPLLVGDSPVLVIALLLVPAAGLVLYGLRFPQPLPLGPPRTAAGALAWVLVAATLWTALDLLRAKFDPGGFWGPLFLSQAGAPGARLTPLGGPWLVTFALAASGLALGALAASRPRRAALAPVALAAALLAPSLAARDPAPGPEVRVAAVQPGYDTSEFDLPVNRFLRSRTRDLERASLDLIGDLAPLTREAARDGARVVVWPEATVWVDPHANSRVREALTGLAAETGTTIVAPFFLRDERAGAAVAVLPDGTLTEARRKHRPMWFLGERAAAASVAPVDAGTTSLGLLLGIDTQEPRPARSAAGAGAELLAAATHDWQALARQQLALARLHAAALEMPLVRADWRYGSAVVSADGRLAAGGGLDRRRAALVGDVALGAGRTPYARIGDAVGWAAVVASALLLGAGVVLRRRASAG